MFTSLRGEGFRLLISLEAPFRLFYEQVIDRRCSG